MATGKSSTLPEPTVYSNSKLSKILFTYQWKVEKFIDFVNRQYEIPSPEFIPNPIEGSIWRLVLFTKHLYPEGPHLAVSLIKLSDDNEPHGVKYTISLVTDNSCNCIQTREKTFHQSLDSDVCVIISHDKLAKRKLLQYPLRPNLTIRCEMDILLVENSNKDLVETPHHSAKRCGSVINNLSFPSSSRMDCDVKMEYADKANNLYYSPNPSDGELATHFTAENEESLNALSDDFRLLYMKKQLADITIVAEGKSIGAHKAVLGARSDILRTASDEGQICITGIRSTIMEAILYFMYTGKTRQLTVDRALDMLRAAKRFHIQSLQKLTEDFLKSNIKLENVIDVLELVDELNLDDLKHTCLKFVSHNHFELEQTEKWQVVLKKNPRVAGQVLLAIASVQALNIS